MQRQTLIQLTEGLQEGSAISNLCIKNEDRQAIKTMGKLLGKTDIDGQISEIDLTEAFIETKISDAIKEKEKNEKLYKTLGMVTGLGIIIILF